MFVRLLWQYMCWSNSGHFSLCRGLPPQENPIREEKNVSAQLYRNLVRLQRAVLCADCEVISETNNGHRDACASQALLNLSRILGGSLGTETTFEVVSSAYVDKGQHAHTRSVSGLAVAA